MLKRIFDFLFSLLLIIILWPVFLVVAFLVKIKLGGPVLFKQRRVGFQEKEFTIIKFRTMTDQRDGSGELLSDDLRLTRFGVFLRSTSLDELPQLINILKGDMSFVGPRPLLVEYLPLYSKEQRRRHEVKPGITGWAQVNGRNGLSWEKRFQHNVWYVDHQSFWLDMKILWMTIKIVLKRDGVSSDTTATMEKFTGNNNT